MYRFILLFFITSVSFLFGLVYINRFYVYPTINETKYLNSFFNNQSVRSKDDLIKIQNLVYEKIKHVNINNGRIDIIKNINSNSGYCFDRSLILQKYLLLKGFKIRPVYLFYNGYNNKTKWYHFFYKNVKSHNIFEFYYQGEWYVMYTNDKMIGLIKLDQYFFNNHQVPSSALYVRYLFSRNGYFIKPNLFPDIYFFN